MWRKKTQIIERFRTLGMSSVDDFPPSVTAEQTVQVIEKIARSNRLLAPARKIDGNVNGKLLAASQAAK